MENLLLKSGLSERSKEFAQAIMLAMEDKDPITYRHGDHVADLMANLATVMNLDTNQVADAYLAGLVHDVGKIVVPDYILTKPGKLTVDEFSIMKTHPEKGAEMLERVSGLKKISHIARYHHERYDGGGYPSGLSGNKIPYFSRMLCVCDAYDAMTSFRGYREPVSKKDALTEIAVCSGKQFDPVISGFFINSQYSSENSNERPLL